MSDVPPPSDPTPPPHDPTRPPTGATTPPTGGAVPTSTAGLGQRFLARLLDGLIVFIPAGIVLGIAGFGAGLGGDSIVFSVVTSLLWFAYYVYFESTTGATLGKKLMNLRVVQADGTPPSTEAAAKRNAWMLFGIVPIIGGLAQFIAVIVIAITINGDPNNRGKHDEIAGTGVLANVGG